MRGEELKKELLQKYRRKVRGSLKQISCEGLRERIARLIAIFDEVQLDPALASELDARQYAGANKEAIGDVLAD